MLDDAFLRRDPVTVARELIGVSLVCRGTAGVIVETEAYHESEPAAHSYRGLTPRNRALFGPPAHTYVYFTYGMHFCFNAVTGPEGEGAAVLIRAVAPTHGLDRMHARRERPAGKRTTRLKPLADRDLCAGPARLVQAMGILPTDNELPLLPAAGGGVTVEALLEGGEAAERPLLVADPANAGLAGHGGAGWRVASGPRIGIREATDLPWRFGVAGSRWLSKPLQ